MRRAVPIRPVRLAFWGPIFLACGMRSGLAADEARVEPGPRGGTLVTTAHHRFEVFFYRTGLRVFPGTGAGAPVPVETLTGSASFLLPGVEKPFDYPLKASVSAGGRPAESLDLAVDLTQVPASGSIVAFRIDGLKSSEAPGVSFRIPFLLRPAGTRRAPAGLTVTRATRMDQAAINAQRVCLVSRAPLGSMGTPVKVTRGDRSIFLCCQSCVKRVQANPDRYLGPSGESSR